MRNVCDSNRDIIAALKELGYVPPNCIRIELRLAAGDVPRIFTEAYADSEVANYLKLLGQRGLEVYVSIRSKAFGDKFELYRHDDTGTEAEDNATEGREEAEDCGGS